MKILYDLTATQPNGSTIFHGGGEYGKIVFEHLIKNSNQNEIIAFYDNKRNIDEKIVEQIDNNKIELINVNTKEELQDLLNIGEFDKFYSALPYRFYGIDFSKTNLIYTIHGLRSIEMPTDKYEIKFCLDFKSKLKYFYKNIFRKKFYIMQREIFNKIINVDAKSRKIVVPSNHTKYALLNEFPEIKTEDIKVFYSPRKTAPNRDEVNLAKHYVEKDSYFLLISGDRWLKNNYRAVIALDNLFSKFPNIEHKVLLLGVKNKNVYLNRIKNKDRFILNGYVEDDVLELLYKNAFCFVYPTLNEGFGYPPLECMKYGTPVICSSITSIPEICKHGVFYFNPYSIDELQNRILNLLYDHNLRKEFSNKGLEISRSISKMQDNMLDELINFINEPI